MRKLVFETVSRQTFLADSGAFSTGGQKTCNPTGGVLRSNSKRAQKRARRSGKMKRIGGWHASCEYWRAMMRKLEEKQGALGRIRACAALSVALVVAVLIPGPHRSAGGPDGQLFTVVGGDYVSPFISSPRGVQTLNARMNAYARFAGYDQIRTIVHFGAAREVANVTRYCGDIFNLLGVDFVLREPPGMESRPAFISEAF